MTIFKTVIRGLLLFASLLLSASAGAREGGACKPDVVKFCDEVLPGGGRVMVCLEAHRNELSASCQRLLAAVRQRDACKADAVKFCDEVLPGGGRVMVCLEAHRNELSASCQELLAATIK